MIRFLLNALTLKSETNLWSRCIVYFNDGNTREFTMVKSLQRDFWTRIETTTSISMIRTGNIAGYDLID